MLFPLAETNASQTTPIEMSRFYTMIIKQEYVFIRENQINLVKFKGLIFSPMSEITGKVHVNNCNLQIKKIIVK